MLEELVNLGPQEKWIPGMHHKYYATMQGQIFHVYPSGKTREVKGYQKGNLYVVKLSDSLGHYVERPFNRVIWETFKGPIPDGYLVTKKIVAPTENGLHNLRLQTKAQRGKKTGGTSRNKEVVLLDEKGTIIDSWASARQAAKDLYVSRQTVTDVCNGRVKKPMINVRWAKKMDLAHPRIAGEFLAFRDLR